MKGRVIGMVQTRPLPGSYRNRGERISFITEQALEETRILTECGVQSVILQNMGDMPIRQQSAPEAIDALRSGLAELAVVTMPPAPLSAPVPPRR